MVTVALDTAGPEAALPHVEAAKPEHPSLIDQAHLVDELLGVVNVPNGVWVNESGVIVRPAETAYARDSRYRDVPIPEDADDRTRDLLALVKGLRVEGERYVAALRDWVDNGDESPYALTPDEVVARSQPRSRDEAEAAASFELGQHLHRSGRPDAAVKWFRAAHKLQPQNWTYKRQAWTFADPGQGPNDVYEGNWVDDVKAIGPENYYPEVDLTPRRRA